MYGKQQNKKGRGFCARDTRPASAAAVSDACTCSLSDLPETHLAVYLPSKSYYILLSKKVYKKGRGFCESATGPASAAAVSDAWICSLSDPPETHFACTFLQNHIIYHFLKKSTKKEGDFAGEPRDRLRLLRFQTRGYAACPVFLKHTSRVPSFERYTI